MADRGTHLDGALVRPARSRGAPPWSSLASDLWSQVCLWQQRLSVGLSMAPRPASQHHPSPVSPRAGSESLLPTPQPSATMPRQRRRGPSVQGGVLPTQRTQGPAPPKVQPAWPGALACHHLHHSPALPGPSSLLCRVGCLWLLLGRLSGRGLK